MSYFNLVIPGAMFTISSNFAYNFYNKKFDLTNHKERTLFKEILASKSLLYGIFWPIIPFSLITDPVAFLNADEFVIYRYERKEKTTVKIIKNYD